MSPDPNSTSIIKRYPSTADKQEADKDLEHKYGGEKYSETEDSAACAYAQCEIETITVTAQRRDPGESARDRAGLLLSVSLAIAAADTPAPGPADAVAVGVVIMGGATIGGIYVYDKVVHGNSSQSMRGTEVYYLINNASGAIDKIGITSNPAERYSQAYLTAENVTYVPQAQYQWRYAAMVDENIRLTFYRFEHGELPRLNKLTR